MRVEFDLFLSGEAFGAETRRLREAKERKELIREMDMDGILNDMSSVI